MTYVKILESELNNLISIKDNYHTNCAKLYQDIEDRDNIIIKLQEECMQACADKQAIIDSMDETVVPISDASQKISAVNSIMDIVNENNNRETYSNLKTKYLNN